MKTDNQKIKLFRECIMELPGARQSCRQNYTRFNHPGNKNVSAFISHDNNRINVSIHHPKILKIAKAIFGPCNDKAPDSQTDWIVAWGFNNRRFPA